MLRHIGTFGFPNSVMLCHIDAFWFPNTPMLRHIDVFGTNSTAFLRHSVAKWQSESTFLCSFVMYTSRKGPKSSNSYMSYNTFRAKLVWIVCFFLALQHNGLQNLTSEVLIQRLQLTSYPKTLFNDYVNLQDSISYSKITYRQSKLLGFIKKADEVGRSSLWISVSLVDWKS